MNANEFGHDIQRMKPSMRVITAKIDLILLTPEIDKTASGMTRTRNLVRGPTYTIWPVDYFWGLATRASVETPAHCSIMRSWLYICPRPSSLLVVTGASGWFTARRGAFDRVMAVLDMISEGPAAEARHRLGTVWYQRKAIKDDRHDSIEDLFTILWAARRIDAVRRSIGLGGLGRPQQLLRQTLQSWVKYWAEPSPIATGWPVNPTTRLAGVAIVAGATLDWDDVQELKDLYNTWYGNGGETSSEMLGARALSPTAQ